MKVFVFSILDRATKLYGAPMTFLHQGIALRSFTDQINDPQSDLFRHPQDYDLYELGTFDSETASFVGLHSPKLLARGDNLSESRRPPRPDDVRVDEQVVLNS